MRPGPENRMRISALLSLAVLAGCMPMTHRPAQSSAGVEIGIQLGSERPVFRYSRERYGDWRSNYELWEPVTLFVIDARFFDREAGSARAVVVYRRKDEYFLPPQEKEWIGKDKRYDYKRRPKDEDYARIKVRP
jgi:hypothetical protein